jgi:Spy/CpxP family protein refolding chaperone
MNEFTPDEESQQWQEMRQKLIDIDLNLTPQQETLIRQVHRQFSIEMCQLFQGHPLMPLVQLMAASSLPQSRDETKGKVVELYERFATPMIAYRDGIFNVLTPEQQVIFKERFSQQCRQSETQVRSPEGSSETSPEGSSETSPEGSSETSPEDQWQLITTEAEYAQQWEIMKQRFRDAGVPLTPEQEVQMQVTNARLQTELTQEFQTGMTST